MEWIDVNDKKPDENQKIKMKSEGHWEGEGIFQDETFIPLFVKGHCFGSVTHWCELQSKPEESVDDKMKATDVIIGLKPMLFAGTNYYPLGGWDDFKGYFDSIEDAMKFIDDRKEDFSYCSWCHIVIDNKIILKGSTTYNYFTQEGKMEWEKPETD